MSLRGAGLVLLALAACSFSALGSGESRDGPDSGSDSSTGGSDTAGTSQGSSNSASASAGTSGSDTATPTTGNPGTSGSSGGNDTTGGAQVEWWDTSYANRIPLHIQETADGPLPAGYSVVLAEYDWGALQDATELKTRGEDLRVVHHTPAGGVEIHRRVRRLSAPDSEIWFKTVEPFADGDDDYYIYFNNPDAVDPPQYWSDSMGADAPSEVYLAADSFQEHQQNDCPDGWGDCGATWSVRLDGPNRYLYNGAYAEYLLSGSAAWQDVWVEASVFTRAPSGCPGIATRAVDSDNLVYSGYGCEDDSVPVDSISTWVRTDGAYTPIVWQNQPIVADQWYRIATAWTGDEVHLFHNDNFVGSATASDAAAMGQAGFFGTYGTELRGDDIIVRMYVNPEPKVTAGPLETWAG